MEVKMTDSVNLVILGALISFFSSLVGATSAILVTWISKKSEERKHRREIIVNAAIQNWKQVADLLLVNKSSFQMPPLDSFLFHMAATADIVFSKDLSPEKVVKELNKVDALLDAVEKQRIMSGSRAS